MSKKILLVKLEDLGNYQVYPPFGLMYLISSLRDHGYEFEIFHERATKKNLNILYEKAKESFLVAFSVMTSPSLYHTLQCSKELKKMKVPVVWGGVHPSMLPETTIKEHCIDYIILGEGEETFISLLKKLEAGEEPKNIEGIGFKKGKELNIEPMPAPLKDLDKYKLPWDCIDVERYIQPRFGGYRRVLPIITSRGCPHGCYFCYNQCINKRKWRGHSAEYIVKDILYLKKKYNLDAIFFGDDNFFTNKKRAFEIVEQIDLPWMADVRADYIDEEFAAKAGKLKCHGLYVGCESGSNRVLKDIINKGITTEKVERAVKVCGKHGIRMEASFVIAFPGESAKEIRQTMDFMLYLYNKYDNVFFWAPKIYTPYPGTPLFQTSLDYGLQELKTSYEWAITHRCYKCNLPWIKNKRKMGLLFLMVGLAQMKNNILTWPIKKLEEWRWRTLNLSLPLELEVAGFLSRNRILTGLFFKYFRD